MNRYRQANQNNAMPYGNGDAGGHEAAGAWSATPLTRRFAGERMAAAQKQIHLERSLSFLRRMLPADPQSIRQAALFSLGALLLAGCVGTSLIPASQPAAAPWPEPGHEVVYNFATTPGEIILRRGSTTKQHSTSTAVPEKIYLGRRVS
jgi:hypothetical protein